MDKSTSKTKSKGGDAKYERQRRYQQRRYKTDDEFREGMKQRVVRQRKEKIEENQEFKATLYKKQAEYLRNRYKTDPEYAEKRRLQSRQAYLKKKMAHAQPTDEKVI